MIFTSPEQSAELRGLPASGPLTGHGGADYRVRENVVNNLNNAFEGISPIKKTGNEAAAGRPSGRQPPSKKNKSVIMNQLVKEYKQQLVKD